MFQFLVMLSVWAYYILWKRSHIP